MHTYSHKNYDKLSQKEIDFYLDKMMQRFRAYNIKTNIFRLAYGVVNKKLAYALQQRNLVPILWSSDTNDYSKKYRSYKKVLKRLSPGDIILMHDHATKPDELEQLIFGIQMKGYKIVPLKEILKYPSKYPF